MSVLYEVYRADPTDTQVLGRYMSQELALRRAQEMADERGERLRVVERGAEYGSGQSWTLEPDAR